MEFIPLERYSKKGKSKVSTEEKKVGKNKKSTENETSDEVVVKKTKSKPRTKVIEKKNVKNKYKETLALKQKKRVPKKKKPRGKQQEAGEEDENVEEEEEEKQEEMEVDDEDKEEDSDEEEDEEEEEEKNEDEEAFKRKCKEMDEKKKNRLFVKFNKKISNKGQIKELHPDIRDVIFPRKRNSRWCWAVFASEERADEALKQLTKNKEILVSKPTPYDKVNKKLKDKMKTVLRKKEAKKKLQKMWM